MVEQGLVQRWCDNDRCLAPDRLGRHGQRETVGDAMRQFVQRIEAARREQDDAARRRRRDRQIEIGFDHLRARDIGELAARNRARRVRGRDRDDRRKAEPDQPAQYLGAARRRRRAADDQIRHPKPLSAFAHFAFLPHTGQPLAICHTPAEDGTAYRIPAARPYIGDMRNSFIPASLLLALLGCAPQQGVAYEVAQAYVAPAYPAYQGYPVTQAYPEERGVVCAVKYGMRQNYWNAGLAQADGATVIIYRRVSGGTEFGRLPALIQPMPLV